MQPDFVSDFQADDFDDPAEILVPAGGQRDQEVPQGAFRIRLADGDQGRREADQLVGRMYERRGYDTAFLTATRAGEPFTLVAFDAGHALGTLTLKLDSGNGLSVDELYRVEVDAVRGPQRRLCELVRLAVERGRDSKRVLASLFHTAYIYGRLLNRVTDVFIEVNPRHVAFYQRMLGFHVAGPERLNTRVDAPGVLLRLELDYVDRQIAALGGQGDSAAGLRSLYPYFFSAKEAQGIADRLRRAAQEG